MSKNLDTIQFGEVLNLFGSLIGQTDHEGNFIEGNISEKVAYMLLNLGIKKLGRSLLNFNENYFLDTYHLDMVEGEHKIVLPDSFEEIKQLWIDYSGTGDDLVRAVYQNPNNVSFLNDLKQFNEKKPMYFTLDWRTISIYPTPTITTSNKKAIQVWATTLPSKATSRTSNIKLPHDYIDYIATFGAMQVAMREQDHQQAGMYKAILDDLKADIKDQVKNRVEDEDKVMDLDDDIWEEELNNFENDLY